MSCFKKFSLRRKCVCKFIKFCKNLCLCSSLCAWYYSLEVNHCLAYRIDVLVCSRENILVDHFDHCVYFNVQDLAVFFKLCFVVGFHFFLAVNTKGSVKFYVLCIQVVCHGIWSCLEFHETALCSFCLP